MSDRCRSGDPGKSPGRPLGLRGQRKQRTRAAIRDAALRLFADQGYAHTTVEQIAREAGVSHTTFFRYFVSKEQMVIADDLDDLREETLASIPRGLGRFDLLRALIRAYFSLAMDDPWASSQARARLIMSEPTLRVANQIEADAAISHATEFFARYLGVAADDRRLQVFVAAAGGVMFHIACGVPDVAIDGMLDRLLEAVDLLEQGLPV
ncbi:TetR/AcrR family transcriptional regulator [Gordonia sp. NPDC003376]